VCACYALEHAHQLPGRQVFLVAMMCDQQVEASLPGDTERMNGKYDETERLT
jgi:hypothetical protein